MDTFRAAGTKRGRDEHLAGEPQTDSPRKKIKTLDNPAGQVLDKTAAGDHGINTRAGDLANTYAPDATLPALRSAYLQEVGDRDLYFTRTPQGHHHQASSKSSTKSSSSGSFVAGPTNNVSRPTRRAVEPPIRCRALASSISNTVRRGLKRRTSLCRGKPGARAIGSGWKDWS
jgi:hypothetical protein